MVTFLSYLFYFLASSASSLQRRWIAREKASEGINQIDFAFRVNLIPAILSLAWPFLLPFHLSSNISYLLSLSLICGLFGAGFFIASYIAQKHVEAGVTTLLSNIYTPVTILLASLFLNEFLTPPQILGTVVLLFAMVLVSKKHRLGRIKFDRNFWLMITAGIMLGVVLTAERALQKETGFAAASIINYWSQSIFLGLAVIFTKSKSKYSYADIFTTGMLRSFQLISWVTLLMVVGNISLVSAVTTFKVVVMFIAAAIFLKEREDLPRKILGSFIAVVGLLLMR